MDQETTAAFQVAIGRDANGKTVPMVIVKIQEFEAIVMLTRPEARALALDILAAEARCAGRQVVAVERTDGNLNS
jgi:hypothetical protein